MGVKEKMCSWCSGDGDHDDGGGGGYDGDDGGGGGLRGEIRVEAMNLDGKAGRGRGLEDLSGWDVV